jgi:lipid A 3-O-deacylase
MKPLLSLCRRGVTSAVFLAIGLGSTPAGSAERHSTLSIIFENDLFYHADRDYTNGMEASWTPAEGAIFPVAIAASLPKFLELDDVRATYSVGQMMFTPEHTALAVPPLNERPYAGFLYGALTLATATGSGQSQLRLQLGMIGPASLAADSQRLIHSLRGFSLPQGWNTQLRDEPGLVITYRKSMPLASLGSQDGMGMNIGTHLGGSVGNVFDYLGTGVMARAGFHMPADEGPPRMDPSGSGSYSYNPVGAVGAYLFAGAEARFVGRNIFVDGNSFQASRSVSKKAIVGDLIVGGAVAFEDFQLSFTHVFRSREYARQKQFDEFGTLNLSVNF